MADDVGLYWSLFQGQFPDEWKRDAGFIEYLSELSGYSLEKLQLEPGHLKEESRLVLNSTQKLAFNNYQTFIQTAECTREVFKDFIAVEDHVIQLMERLPTFSDTCKTFTSHAQDIMEKRKLNSLALSKHSQLLEVLEIPQVMETCVRNGYYEEALELSGHVNRMSKKHGGIPIIMSIVGDIERSLDLMLTQLLQQLRGSIQLPSCLRIVGFLKRMNVYSDAELRLKFLQARDSWLQGVLLAIPADDAYQHISKTIETSRVHLFDIVTQYRAIFPDGDGKRSTNTTTTTRINTVPGALFYTWLNTKVWEFLLVLEKDLLKGVGGRMDSLLGQAMYFGLSFSRIGADFRCLITPLFIRVLLSSFRQSVRNAKHQFHDSIKQISLATSLRGSNDYNAHSTHSLTPPHSLLDHAPLAALTNQLIAGFNALRQCAPLSIAAEICSELRRLLESVVHDIIEYHRIEHGSFTERETLAFRQFVGVVVSDFLPFIESMYNSLFKKQSVEFVAMTTPYALKHHKDSNTPKLDLAMDLNVNSIAQSLHFITED